MHVKLLSHMLHHPYMRRRHKCEGIMHAMHTYAVYGMHCASVQKTTATPAVCSFCAIQIGVHVSYTQPSADLLVGYAPHATMT